MPEIVTAIDPAIITRVIEANINAYRLSSRSLPGAILHHRPDTVWVDSGTALSTVNAVVSAHFNSATIDDQITAVLSHFRQRAVPFSWHIGPLTTPPDLGRSLLAHGLTHNEDEPGMALEIATMRDDFARPVTLTIETVRDTASLAAWVAVWLFPVPEPIRQQYHTLLEMLGYGRDRPWTYYIGRLNGQPVAISTLYVGEGVAAVHNVVTLPEVRRQGIGTAMTLHALRQARDKGYQVAVLTASPDGIGCYRRIGFRDYCWFSEYDWTPD